MARADRVGHAVGEWLDLQALVADRIARRSLLLRDALDQGSDVLTAGSALILMHLEVPTVRGAIERLLRADPPSLLGHHRESGRVEPTGALGSFSPTQSPCAFFVSKRSGKFLAILNQT